MTPDPDRPIRIVTHLRFGMRGAAPSAPHARKREHVTARSELDRRFAHYLRAVILRTPRVATAVTATAAATSSDEIGSTTWMVEQRSERGQRGGERSGDK